MNVGEKNPGITHVSFKVASLDDAKVFIAENGIPISGRFSFKDLPSSSSAIPATT